MLCQLQVVAGIILAASPRCFPCTIAKSAMRDTAVGIWSALERGNQGQHCPGWAPRVRQGAILTTGLVRTLLGHQLSSRWTPVHKPSSNSGNPVAWFTDSATKSCHQKFILALGFISPEFKSSEFKSPEFKSSFCTWSSKVWSSTVHLVLGVQRSGFQKSGVQKFIFALGFKSPEFKSYGFKSSDFKSPEFKSSFCTWSSKVWSSKVRVQMSWVQMFLSQYKGQYAFT